MEIIIIIKADSFKFHLQLNNGLPSETKERSRMAQRNSWFMVDSSFFKKRVSSWSCDFSDSVIGRSGTTIANRKSHNRQSFGTVTSGEVEEGDVMRCTPMPAKGKKSELLCLFLIEIYSRVPQSTWRFSSQQRHTFWNESVKRLVLLLLIVL